MSNAGWPFESADVTRVRAQHIEAFADVRPRGPDRVHVHPAPLLGQHNHDLLSGPGLTDDEIAALAAQGAIGTALAVHGTSKV